MQHDGAPGPFRPSHPPRGQAPGGVKAGVESVEIECVGLRQVVVIALAGWCGWLLVRGLLRRRVPWIGLAVLLVPLLWLGITERQWVSAEQAFSAAARGIAPNARGVHCQRLGETFTATGSYLGSVQFDAAGRPADVAVLSYETCQRLSAWWRSSWTEKNSAPLEQIIAVHVLSHESVHLTGDTNEASTECKAMQLDAQTAVRLGATPAQGRSLALRYWTEVYPRMSPDYVSAGCKPGGPLDQTPDDGIWP